MTEPISDLTLEDCKKAVQALKSMDVRPRCDDHRPIETSPGVIECQNCGFCAAGCPGDD